MITSLGTCRLVMPLSEFTIASGGPRGVHGLDVGLDLGLLGRGQRSGSSRSTSPMPLFGIDAELLERRRVLVEHVLEEHLTAWPNMIGSETFIIVAFRCSENSTPCCLGVLDLRRRETRAARGCS